MSNFPPNISIRPLTIEDINQCIALENKGFSESERCSPEKFQYRLTVCPELCSGIFIRDYEYKYNAINLPEVAEKLDQEQKSKIANDDVTQNNEDEEEENLDELPSKSSYTKETLIGHIIATKIPSQRITDGAMEIPPSTDEESTTIGHIESSRWIGIHSLVVDPNWQGHNLGTLLMHDYVQKLSNQDLGDKIVIIAHKELIPFYEKIGFNNLGESECKFADTTWYDLAIDLIPEEDI
ncbi:aries arylalkylamine N-acetyltransferase [Scheffersomyces coipomensis]|uniref:aries arylalkylamine N-acetyltransferase n=1 Tax=Scheffersomyces coipomensis TaxID=1788519 RepID=UPI00315CAA7B